LEGKFTGKFWFFHASAVT